MKSDGADMALDLINSQIEYFDKFENVYEQAGIGCRYCLEGPLYWVETEGGWRLWDGKQIHSCNEYQRVKPTPLKLSEAG